MALKASNSYKDLSLTFSTHPITQDLVILKDENAIKRAVSNLFAYQQGEKFFDPNFGSTIRRLLFEPVDIITAGLIQDEARRLVSRYEPRVRITDLTVIPDFDENAFEMQMQYIIPNKSTGPYTINLTLLSLRRV